MHGQKGLEGERRKEKARIQGGKGAVPHPRPVKGGRIPPRTQSFHSFQILNWRVKNIKKSLLFIQCTKKIVYLNRSHHDRSPNEMHIYPNRMGAIRNIKQLFLNAKP